MQLASNLADSSRGDPGKSVLTQCSQAPDSRVVQAFVLILAGYETTANALAFAIYLLSTNPAKRERLLAEVDAFGRDRAPTLRDLDRSAPGAWRFQVAHSLTHDLPRVPNKGHFFVDT